MVNFVISGGIVHLEQGAINNAAIIIEKNKIAAIENSKIKSNLHFPDNYHIVPGFIDLHIHGAYGKDVMDNDLVALKIICEKLAEEGVTSFLATTMTASSSQLEKVLRTTHQFMQHQQEVLGAEIIGVHLEGPFISPEKMGAQRGDQVLSPNIEIVKQWQKITNNIIRLITVAPELANSLDFIRFLKEQKIIASIGHTNATYDEAQKAIEAGCSHVTHLFNTMRPIHHREPSAITAALISDQVSAELIADGIHLHPAIIQLAIKAKGKEKIILVTDAMRAKCLGDGTYELGGQSVSVKGKLAYLSDGTLAGSTLTMPAAIRFMMENAQCNLEDALQFASVNPAKVLNIFDRKGSLAVGKDADLVVLDANYEVVLTIVGGRIVYQQK